jgi:hypothetical protein
VAAIRITTLPFDWTGQLYVFSKRLSPKVRDYSCFLEHQAQGVRFGRSKCDFTGPAAIFNWVPSTYESCTELCVWMCQFRATTRKSELITWWTFYKNFAFVSTNEQEVPDPASGTRCQQPVNKHGELVFCNSRGIFFLLYKLLSEKKKILRKSFPLFFS